MGKIQKDIPPDHRDLRGHDRMVVGFTTTYDDISSGYE
jgi:hypothetical protein